MGAHAAFEILRAQRFGGEAVVGGVLVDEDEIAVGGDGVDVGVEHLGERGAEGKLLAGRREGAVKPVSRGRGQDAGGRRIGQGKAGFGEALGLGGV